MQVKHYQDCAQFKFKAQLNDGNKVCEKQINSNFKS